MAHEFWKHFEDSDLEELQQQLALDLFPQGVKSVKDPVDFLDLKSSTAWQSFSNLLPQEANGEDGDLSTSSGSKKRKLDTADPDAVTSQGQAASQQKVDAASAPTTQQGKNSRSKTSLPPSGATEDSPSSSRAPGSPQQKEPAEANRIASELAGQLSKSVYSRDDAHLEQAIVKLKAITTQLETVSKLSKDLFDLDVKGSEQPARRTEQMIQFLQSLSGQLNVASDRLNKLGPELDNVLEQCLLIGQNLSAHRQAVTDQLYLTACADLQRKVLLMQGSTPEQQVQSLSHLLSLLIVKQPWPSVIFKGKAIESPFVVSLLKPPNLVFKSVSAMKATLEYEEGIAIGRNSLMNAEAKMDARTSLATYHDIKINVSSRMMPVRFRFSVVVETATSGPIVVESPPSLPVIVITNESQWCDAAGKVLMNLCLKTGVAGGKPPPSQYVNPFISWNKFFNLFHQQFIEYSRQEVGHPRRPLSIFDTEYLHQHFFGGRSHLTIPQVTTFWEWMGPVLQAIRFKRHANHLWYSGLIFGFITKNTARAILNLEPVGTFILRFSESRAGLFAISFVAQPGQVMHYLVKPEDTGSQKTIADFIHEKRQFVNMMRIEVATGVIASKKKDVLLKPFYSRNKRFVNAPKPPDEYILDVQ